MSAMLLVEEMGSSPVTSSLSLLSPFPEKIYPKYPRELVLLRAQLTQRARETPHCPPAGDSGDTLCNLKPCLPSEI